MELPPFKEGFTYEPGGLGILINTLVDGLPNVFDAKKGGGKDKGKGKDPNDPNVIKIEYGDDGKPIFPPGPFGDPSQWRASTRVPQDIPTPEKRVTIWSIIGDFLNAHHPHGGGG